MDKYLNITQNLKSYLIYKVPTENASKVIEEQNSKNKKKKKKRKEYWHSSVLLQLRLLRIYTEEDIYLERH